MRLPGLTEAVCSLSERTVHAWLKKHPEVVLGVFSANWNFNQLLAEFQFGTMFRADFVVLSANSGYWCASFVELKSPGARLFTKAGHCAADLRQAELQVCEWRRWVQENPYQLKQELAKRVKRSACPQCSVAGRFVSAADEILSPETFVSSEFHLVLGRSSRLSTADRRYRTLFNEPGRPALVTYDRLLAYAANLDSGQARS